MSEATQLKTMLEQIVNKLELEQLKLPVAFVWDYPDMPSYTFSLTIENPKKES